MAQLICLTDKCMLQRVISDLNEILPHIQEGHEVINYDDFKQEWCQIQQQLKDFAGLKDVIYDKINVMKKQLEIIESGLQERFTKIQTINLHLELDLVDYGVQDAIIVYKKSQSLKQDKKGIKSVINDVLEVLNDKVTTIMRDLSNGLVYIDSIVGIIDKQKTIVPKSNIRKHGIKIITKPSSIQTEQIKDSSTNSLVIIQEAVTLQQQSIDKQSARGTIEFKKQEETTIHKSYQYIRNDPLVQEVVNHSFHYALKQQQITNQTTDEEQQMLLKLQNAVQQKQNLQQHHFDQESHPQNQVQSQNQSQVVNLKNSYEYPRQVSLIQQACIKQVRFNAEFSDYDVHYLYDNTEAVFGDRQYLICDRFFQVQGCSTLDVLIIPYHRNTTVRIGIVKVNTLNRESRVSGDSSLASISSFETLDGQDNSALSAESEEDESSYEDESDEEHQNNEESIYSEEDLFIYYRTFVIHSQTTFNLKIEHKHLEYINEGIRVNLEDEDFDHDDEVSFYIESKYSEVIIL